MPLRLKEQREHKTTILFVHNARKEPTMKKTTTLKKLTSLLLTVTFATTLASCGASVKNEAAYDRAPMDMYVETESASGGWADNGSFNYVADSKADVSSDVYYAEEAMTEPQASVTTRKIIYTSDYEIQTKDYDASAAALDALMAKYGAYFENSNTYGSKDSGSRRSNFTVRVPVANYRAFVGEAGTLGVVISTSQNNRDVTESYFDTEARLESAKIREERVLEILKNAAMLDDVLALERELADIRYEIESFTGTLRKYDSLINYSTVTIRLIEVTDIVAPKVTPLTFGERMSKGFSSGINDFVDGLQDFAVMLSYNFIGIVIWLVLIAIAVCALVIVSKKRSARKAARTEKTEPENK